MEKDSAAPDGNGRGPIDHRTDAELAEDDLIDAVGGTGARYLGTQWIDGHQVSVYGPPPPLARTPRRRAESG